jgi:hypothetical protein
MQHTGSAGIPVPFAFPRSIALYADWFQRLSHWLNTARSTISTRIGYNHQTLFIAGFYAILIR